MVPETRPAGAPGFRWPSRPWAWLLLLLILIEMGTHLGFRSPYLYYTEGQYDLEEGTYGLYLGPNGEIVHADAANYWPVEYLFAGKYRGDHLSTIARPGYPFLAALLDNYLHPVHAGWLINLSAWWAAALCAYSLAAGLGGGPAAAKAFSVLVAASPGFISMAGQPMGYVLGYSLHVVFLACVVAWLPSPRPAAAAGALAFLLVLADATYEILGALCALPFLARAWTRLGPRLALACVGAMAAAKLAWDLAVVRAATKRAAGSSLDSGFLDLPSLLASPDALAAAAGHLLWGALLSGLFLVPAIGAIALLAQRGPLLRFSLVGILAVTLPLFAMGVLGETTGSYRFYREGRLVAYYYPFLALAAALGLERLGARLLPEGRRAGPLVLACLLHLAVANLDWAGVKEAYYLFHHREGYRPGEILAP